MQPLSHFEQLKPAIIGYAITKHFKRDLGSEGLATALALDVLESRHEGFEELHKFEGKVGSAYIFRAKIKGKHLVYAISEGKRLLFLRAFSNFKDYGRFLNSKRELCHALERAELLE